MQLRERQYQSRLGARSRPGSAGKERFTVTGGSSRPPLQVMRDVVRWSPLVILAAVVWYLLDTYVF